MAYIEIQSTASRLSAEIRAFVDNVRTLQNQGRKIKGILDQVTYEGDWDALATKLNVSANDAQTVYKLITRMIDDLTSTKICNF